MTEDIKLSPQERRLLVLAMGMVSLEDLIREVEDEELVGKMEATLEASKAEYDELFSVVDQEALVEKLT